MISNSINNEVSTNNYSIYPNVPSVTENTNYDNINCLSNKFSQKNKVENIFYSPITRDKLFF